MGSDRVSGERDGKLPISTEEEDLLLRSKRKVKEGGGVSMDEESSAENGGAGRVPYKDKLMQPFDCQVNGVGDTASNTDVSMMETGLKSHGEVRTVGSGGVEIPLTDEELASWSMPWRNTLVVSVLGRRVNFRIIEAKLKRIWTKHGAIRLIDMHDGYYQVVFSNEEDYKFALFEGPWMVADHYLVVQRWRPFFLMEAEVSKHVAVWVRIPRLPIELYNDTFLRRVGMSLGNFLKVDRLTSIHSRGKFARICVELDLGKPLITHFVVKGFSMFLEYEGLYSICFTCGRFGHKKENCSASDGVEMNVHGDGKKETTGTMTMAGASESKGDDISPSDVHGGKSTNHVHTANVTEANYGPWMTVSKPIRRNKGPIKKAVGKSIDGGQLGGTSTILRRKTGKDHAAEFVAPNPDKITSRFSVLNVVTEDESNSISGKNRSKDLGEENSNKIKSRFSVLNVVTEDESDSISGKNLSKDFGEENPVQIPIDCEKKAADIAIVDGINANWNVASSLTAGEPSGTKLVPQHVVTKIRNTYGEKTLNIERMIVWQ